MREPPAFRPRPGLYAGRVTHRRMRPRQHALSYRVFYLFLDVDAVESQAKTLRFFSTDRFNLLSFHARDHGNGSGQPLRRQVEASAAAAGVREPIDAVWLLTMPRVLGHVFNPLSIFFCLSGGRVVGLVYEVNNTFGQRHSYVIPVAEGEQVGETIRQTCAKRFYVSPFLDMDLTYDFAIVPPSETGGMSVTARDGADPVIATAFSGRRHPLTDGAILRAVVTHPLLTLKVVAAIHWEALKIWLKGIGLRPRPAAPRHATTYVTPHD